MSDFGDIILTVTFAVLVIGAGYGAWQVAKSVFAGIGPLVCG